MKSTKKIDLAPASNQGQLSVATDIKYCNDDITIPKQLQTELDEKFVPKKKQNLKLSAFYHHKEYFNRSERVAQCSTFLEFHCGNKTRLVHANFCRDRLCPVCNWRRSIKIYNQVSKCLNVLESRGYTFLFLTLTVKNCRPDELKDTIDELYSGWRYLYHKSKIFKNTVCGTFRSLEVTRNKFNNTFHPHLHCILVVPGDYFINGYLSQREWTELWQKACKLEYNPIVHIEKFKQENGSYKKAIAEVSKYCAKDNDYLLAFELTDAFLKGLEKRRLCGFTGVFNDVRNELGLLDPEDSDLVECDDDSLRDDITELIVRCSWRYGFYESKVLKNEDKI